jgi:hypothetical protein
MTNPIPQGHPTVLAPGEDPLRVAATVSRPAIREKQRHSPNLLSVAAMCVAACSSTSPRGDNPQARAQFERLKSLAGTWTTTAATGHAAGTFRYTVTAGGSAIQEEMSPGTPNAMVTLFYMDGPDLVLTHYCAAGNQPRMRALPSEPDGTIPFVYAGGTNIDAEHDGHMHGARFRVEGPRSATETWTYHDRGEVDHVTEFVLTR